MTDAYVYSKGKKKLVSKMTLKEIELRMAQLKRKGMEESEQYYALRSEHQRRQPGEARYE